MNETEEQPDLNKGILLMLKKYWKDPVVSRLIAALIIAVVTFLVHESCGNTDSNEPSLNTCSSVKNVAITYNTYKTPGEDILDEKKTVELIIKLSTSSGFKELDQDKQVDFIREQIELNKNEEEAINIEKNYIEIESNEIKNPDELLKRQLLKVKMELFALIEKTLMDERFSPVLKKEVEKIKLESETIVANSNCLLKDFDVIPIRDINSGKIVYGFSINDIKNDPNYILVDRYYDGLARVQRNNKFGFFNKMGELVISYKYDYASNFENGLSIVKNIDRWFIVNTSDIIRLEFPEDVVEVNQFSKGLFKAKTIDNKYFLSPLNLIINRNDYDEINIFHSSDKGGFKAVGIRAKKNDKYGLLRMDKEITDFIYTSMELYDSRFLLFKARIENEKGDSEEFLINNEGKKLTSGYYEIFPYSFGIHAKVSKKMVSSNSEVEIAYGIIQWEREILECKYEEVEILDQPYAIIKNNLYGIFSLNINRTKVVIPCIYSKILPTNINGLFAVNLKQEGKADSIKPESLYQLINVKGTLIEDTKFHELFPFKNKIAVVRRGDRFGVINATGKLKTKFKYQEINSFDNYKLATVKAETGYGVINTDGLQVVIPYFDKVLETSEGYMVTKESVVYPIDRTGNCLSEDLKKGYSSIIDEYRSTL